MSQTTDDSLRIIETIANTLTQVLGSIALATIGSTRMVMQPQVSGGDGSELEIDSWATTFQEVSPLSETEFMAFSTIDVSKTAATFQRGRLPNEAKIADYR